MKISTVSRQKQKKLYVREKAVILCILTGLFLLAVIFAQEFCPYDPYAQDYSMVLSPPSPAHPFGTDRYGRDMLSRVIAGAKTSVFSALFLAAATSAAGTAAGMICGYFGGRIDGAVMGIADLCVAFPSLVFALAIAALLNGGMENAVLALSLVSWPKYARLARSRTLTLKQADFIQAARVAGGSSLQILTRHILPNLLGRMLVTASLDVGTMMMELAGLSFLGLGASPPSAEWGSMMSGGRSMLQTYPWTVITPGIGIFVSVALFNLLGDALRDWLTFQGEEIGG